MFKLNYYYSFYFSFSFFHKSSEGKKQNSDSHVFNWVTAENTDELRYIEIIALTSRLVFRRKNGIRSYIPCAS